ncbi:MAG: hypothetical protein IKT32_05870 [Clostridia bacterium]|nr:hypothetical protein [Clostridia bacterium]
MKRQKFFTLISSFVLVFMLSIVCFAFVALDKTVSAEVVLGGPNYESEYEMGTEIDLVDATISANGKSVQAKPVIHCPDGNIYTGKRLSLDIAGNYIVDYTGEIDGKTYVESVEFLVYEPFVTLKDKYLTKMQYGDHPIHKDLGKGISFDLMSGTEVVFNKVIDINGLTAADPILNFFIIPETMGIPDVQEIKIRLYDVHDESNVLTIAGHYYEVYPASSWWLACATGLEFAAYDPHAIRYGISNMYGAGSKSFCAVKNERPPFEFYLPEFSIRFDWETYGVYADQSCFIMSLLDREIYNEVWGGFTTGEVYVSLEVITYETTANVFVTNLMGCDLSQYKIVDNKGPELTIDYEGNDPENLIAKVGSPYNLFNVEAFDVQSGVVEDSVTVKVYKNYSSNSRVQINVKNNQFIPKDEGLYVAVYEARDYLGNITKMELPIKAVKNPSLPSVIIDDEKITEFFAGDIVSIADIEVDCIGNEKIEISVISPDGKDVYNKDGFACYDVGRFVVKYNVTDYLGQTTEAEYNIDILAPTKSLFYDKVNLPKYIFAGYTYNLPQLDAYDYRSGDEVIRKAKVEIEYLATSEKDVITSGENYNFKGNYEGGLKITYFDGECEENKLVYELKSIITKEDFVISFDKYFEKENIEIVQKYDYLEINPSENIAKMEYVQKLLLGNFETFFIVENGNSISSIELYFENHENENQNFTAKFAKYDGGVGFYINNALVDKVKYNFNSTGLDSQFAFKLIDGQISTGGIMVRLSDYVEELFDFAYFTMKIEGGKDSKIQLQQISGQYFFDDGSDLSAPSIVVTGIGNTFYQVGESYHLENKVLIADVLDPNATVDLMVKAPDGTIVKAKDGTLLQNVEVSAYDFDLTSYGSYTVYYTAKDSHNGIANVFQYKVFVLDDIAPVITLAKSVPASATVDNQITLPSATLSDNMSLTNSTVYIYVMDPSNKVVEVDETNSFKPVKKGLHKAVYMATDDFGNIAMLTFDIIVE